MTKRKELTWVYPQNNWISNFNKTFVYGWCNPKAKLFVSYRGKPMCLPIQIFPNGNFAQTIQLPHKKNVIRLIQVLDRKVEVITRHIITRKHKQSHVSAGLSRQTLKLPRNDKDLVIVIDPGHGGKEHGTHSPKGIPEKHFNLQIAKLLFKKLRRSRGMLQHASTNGIYLTRSSDKFVSLKDRINFAKKKKCNIFISIHHNALPDNENPLKHKGIGIYYTHDSIKPLVKSLLESISKETKLKKYGMFKRDFAVTRPAFYCGVLIECGFLIHPEEGEYITKRKVQEKIVKGIIKGI